MRIHIAVAVKVRVLENSAFQANPEQLGKIPPYPAGFVLVYGTVGTRIVKPVQYLHGLLEVVLVNLPVRVGIIFRDGIELPDQVDLYNIVRIDLFHLVKHGQDGFQAVTVIAGYVVVPVYIRVLEVLDYYLQKLHVLLVEDAVSVIVHDVLDPLLQLGVVLDRRPYTPYQELRLGKAFDALEVPLVYDTVVVDVQIFFETLYDPQPVINAYLAISCQVEVLKVQAGLPLNYVGEGFHPLRLVNIENIDDPITRDVICSDDVALDNVGV